MSSSLLTLAQQGASGFCLVFDTSSLVECDGVAALLRGTGLHAVVIPWQVEKELQGLGEKTMLGKLRQSPWWKRDAAAGASSPSSCSPSSPARTPKFTQGITRQKENGESYGPLDAYARCPDAHVLSCALYFAGVSPAECAKDGKEEYADEERLERAQRWAKQRTTRGFGKPTVLVTEDTILRIKARAYAIPAITFGELMKVDRESLRQQGVS